MTSGPTQNYEDAELGRWRPRPVAAGVVRVLIVTLPLVLAIGFGVAAARWLPAARLGVDPWAWIAVEITVSTGLLLVATRLARRLMPLSSLLRLTLYFPDRAPSRFAVAARHYSPAALRTRIDHDRAHGTTPTDEHDHAALLLDLVAAIGAHDEVTRGHSERVQAYAALIATELGLSEPDAAKLSWAALLHDIGKLDVPAEILNKTTRPTDDEWQVLATHPTTGLRIAAPLASWLGPWLGAISQHHERWDGAGYPHGLAGTAISPAARIVAVADTYDVITSTRSYKKPLSAQAAREELARSAGTQFDPDVVRAMLAVGLGKLQLAAGPLSLLSSLPGLGATPLPNLATLATNATTAATTAGAAATAALLGATLALTSPSTTALDNPPATTADVAVEAAPAAGSRQGAAGTGQQEATPAASPGSTTTPSPSTPAPTPAPTAGPGTPTVETGTGAGTSGPAPAPAPASTSTPAPAPPPAPAPGTTPCARARAGSANLDGADLTSCDLSGVTLTGSFVNATLSGADLTGATLSGADFTGAQLNGADLDGTSISSTSFAGARLTGASFVGASVTGSSFVGAALNGNTLDGASTSGCTFD
ncbi:HD domain-containing phosphohydrolase [Actinotalea sp.]|uniref:HD domain-containing phosphohydrolase n=1 Tax=Actinotalea sp. TaxID=1872145 RepID=UPI002CA42E19|nr:HD domain-containing phosphohydrolase [Actinotalea sp.]HQY33173.1 pentapeptide repeat-containing protein [Actinotalea sp.]HRA50762.1 pentapeptide repeat-containing protein [Actinotalea sp.]